MSEVMCELISSRVRTSVEPYSVRLTILLNSLTIHDTVPVSITHKKKFVLAFDAILVSLSCNEGYPPAVEDPNLISWLSVWRADANVSLFRDEEGVIRDHTTN